MEQKDRRIEIVTGILLLSGVIAATAVVLIGAAIYLVKYGRYQRDLFAFAGEPVEFKDLSAILRAALALRGRAIIQLGLIILIATPVARVAFSVVAFIAEKDHVYTAITLIVLAILAFSLSGYGMALMTH